MEDGVGEREEEQVQVVVEEKQARRRCTGAYGGSSGERGVAPEHVHVLPSASRSRSAQDRRVAWEFSADSITVEGIGGWRQIATVLSDMLCATLMLACWQHA
jgi:hypothetical protein